MQRSPSSQRRRSHSASRPRCIVAHHARSPTCVRTRGPSSRQSSCCNDCMRRRSSCVSYGRAVMATGFLPLDGVRVVDVTSSLAGPYCTEILAALGADVVKVEHPQHGDESRAWGPPFHEGSSVMFYAANLGKRSLALDVKRG